MGSLMTSLALLRLLDASFVVLHTALVGFNLSGWAWRRTRLAHLLAICLTLLFWFGAGIVYGWGYCPLTDWHWRVKRALGETSLPASWVKYHLDAVTGVGWNAAIVDALVIGCALLALGLSLALNARDRLRSPRFATIFQGGGERAGPPPTHTHLSTPDRKQT